VKTTNATSLLLLQLKAAGLPKPKLEYRFAPPRRWRFDFAWPGQEFPVAMEIEGGGWVNGRHHRPVGAAKDMEKYNTAAEAGWYVYRYTPQMIEDGTAIEQLKRVLQ
jgi:hypothetical protein